MTEYRLAYRDRYARSLLGLITEDTTEDSVNNELWLNPSQKNYLVLEVTGEEYAKMFASMLAGTELIYSEESQNLHWLFWKASKTMTFCDAVAACIESGVLDEVLGDRDLGNPDVIIDDGTLNDDLSQGQLDNCEDALWGACVSVVDGIFDTTLEVLQKISLATEPLAAIGEITELMGVVGRITGIAVTLVDWVTDTALALFEAVDSPAVRDAIACDLFCLCRTDCTVTYNYINLAFEKNLLEPIPIPIYSSLKDKLEWLFNLVMSGEPNVKIAATINMLGVWTMIHGGKFGAYLLSVRTLPQLILLGQKNNASSDWVILCDTCTSPCVSLVQDYENGLLPNETPQDGTIVNLGSGAHSPDNALGFSINGSLMLSTTDFVVGGCDITRVSWWYRESHGSPNKILGLYVYYLDENDGEITNFAVTPTEVSDGTWRYIENVQYVENVHKVRIQSGVSTSYAKNYVYMDDIEIN